MLNNIYTEILNILGLEVRNGRIFDLDKGQYLIFNGNYIYTDNSVIIHRRDIKLNLLTNNKLVEYFLNVLFQKEAEENGFYVQMMSLVDHPNNNPPYLKRAINIITTMGTYQSDYFFNCCLSYIHMMYLVSGTPLTFDLHQYDLTREQVFELYGDKKKK